MNNELGRKITSLTLMTIMLAGGMTIAAPSMMPAAHAANANLFVSAENSQFDNYMSGPQVIEVVVIDSDINDTDEAKGEPDITINGKIMRMVQAVDGNWYGYFADRTQAQIADSTSTPDSQVGLDFGEFCSADSASVVGLVSFTDSNGVAFPMMAGGIEGDPNGAPITNTCVVGTATMTNTANGSETYDGNNVVREPKDVNLGVPNNGQIGINEDFWPFIQLYTLNPTGNVVVQYNKGGGVQTTTLTFDTVDQYAGAELDRTAYPAGTEVHATITDLWLNIDPTDEDSWTFGTFGTVSTNYQVFDENGGTPGDVAANTDSDLTNRLADLMCEDNCVLEFNPNVQGTGNIATLQDNDDSEITNVTIDDGVNAVGATFADADVPSDGLTSVGELGGFISFGPAALASGPVTITQGPNVATATFIDAGPAGLDSPAELSALTGNANFIGIDDPTAWQTANANLGAVIPITITEQGPNSGVFGTYDESDKSNIIIRDTAARGTSASFDYNETAITVLVGLTFGTIDIIPIDDEWNSGEEIPVELFDGDANRNSRADEDLDLNNPDVLLIPSLETGSPTTLSGLTSATLAGNALTGPNDDDGNPIDITDSVQAFSDRALVTSTGGAITPTNNQTFELTFGTMNDFFDAAPLNDSDFQGFGLFNYDIRSLSDNISNIDSFDITLAGVSIATGTTDRQGLIVLDRANFENLSGNTALTATFTLNDDNAPLMTTLDGDTTLPVVADIFGFGFTNDGLEADERVANQIIRLELEETGDNTSLFEGSLEYIMINQLNILDEDTYANLSTIADDPSFIVIEDLTDEDSPRVNYLDLGADGVSTQIADQEEAPSHSGIVSFDLDTYKVADTVVITLQDLDLNVDSDLIDIYTTVSGSTLVPALNDVVGDDANNFVFSDGDNLGRVLDVTFDDVLWTSPTPGTCFDSAGNSLESLTFDTGLARTGFTLIETDRESGKFIGDWQIPSQWCRPGSTSVETTTGLDLEVNYVDFRDASGEVIEVGDSAGVRANTGSVSLDRTVYPVPFGVPDNFGTLTGETSPDNRSIFAIHASGINGDLTDAGTFLPDGDLIVHIRVNDPDFDISASGEDTIAQARQDIPVGPVELSIIRGSDTVILGHAGGPNVVDGKIFVGDEIPVNQAFSGDGQIQFSELSLTGFGSGFNPANDILIQQTGATDATADFDDIAGNGMVDNSGELTIFNSQATFQTGETVNISQSGAIAGTALFTDAGLDGAIGLSTELSGFAGGSDFIDGTVTITGATSGAVASASFDDDPAPDGIIDAGELTILTGGSGFVTGPVTLTQAAPPTTDATATFTDELTEINSNFVRDFGPIDEIAPDAGIFEIDVVIQYTDGPADTQCPATADFDASNDGIQTETSRFSTASPSGEDFCILQGDILQVEYTDPTDASGDINTVTDSATFDLRNGVLQSDKSVYIIGSDMILTLIEPDLDLDNDQAETWDLDLIEWDSDAATITMGDADGEGASFDPEPLNFRETGDSTGIFQIVIEIPEILEGDRLERGEEIILEYTDWGPSGSDFVGDEDEDVNLTLYTSNFGATVELDQKVYSWTDKVYVTVVAPDHNFDSDLIDEVGESDLDPIKISTRGFDLDNYKLVETGTDTGIFTGEVILTGFIHDADGDGTDDTNPRTTGNGPTDGFLQTDDDDGLTVSFEFSEDETVVGSALIRWNIGEVQWLEASYPASGTGVVRVIDPDMNLDPEAVDNFAVDVWSDSDAGGIDLTVTETNEATGIFEGTVFFTVTDESSGHRLRVAEGDTVTAEYEDNTLPDPYTTADELDITATSLIGTVVPPLERAPIASCRVVDAFGNSLSTVSVDQQVQITCDLANGQDREQQFAYLIQVQDGNGVTVSLAWITGSLAAGQSFSPALSWIPESAGAHDATAFVWESVDNPTALSPPVSTPITVN